MEVFREAGLIRLAGELGAAEASSLKECLLEALAGESELSLDLSGVERLDVCCLQVLLAAWRHSPAPRLAGLSSACREAVGLAGLEADQWPPEPGGS
jgi:anti-anti-sigma regulatory factor